MCRQKQQGARNDVISISRGSRPAAEPFLFLRTVDLHHKRWFRRVYPLESLGCSAASIKCRNEHKGSVSVTLFVSLAAITGTFQSSELQTREIQQPAWFRVTAHCVTSFIWKIIFRLIEIIPTPAVEKSLKRSRATRRAPGRMGGLTNERR